VIQNLEKYIKQLVNNQRRLYLVIFFSALIVRLAFITTLENKWYFYDTEHYDKAARSILEGKGFGTGFNFSNNPELRSVYSLPPMYPLFLAAIYYIFGRHFFIVRIFQSIISALTCLMVYFIGDKVFNERKVGFIAAFISVFYPLLIFSSGLLYIEALFTFFISLSIYYVFKMCDEQQYVWFSILTGLFLGLAALARPVIFSFFPFLVLWVLMIWIKPFKKRLTAVALIFSSAILVIAPWTIRNYNVFGRFVPVSAEVDHELSAVVKASLESVKIQQVKVAGDELKVVMSSDAQGHHFDYFINGQYDGRLTDPDKLQGNAPILYSGIMLKGGLNNNVDEFSICDTSKNGKTATTKHIDTVTKNLDNFERTVLGTNWKSDQEYEINSGELSNTSAKKSWEFLAVYMAQTDPTEVAIKWGRTADGKGVNEGGLALMLDKPSVDASGYLVWRTPIGYLELWTIVNGVPQKFIDNKLGIHSIDNPWDTEGSSKFSMNPKRKGTFETIYTILISDPKTFFRRYFSEFIHFWSLFDDRVEAKNQFNSSFTMLISMLSFTPILILFLIGLLFSIPKWRKPLVLFFVILSFALGYSFFQTRVRYRIPVEPYIIIFAANGLVVVWEKIKLFLNRPDRSLLTKLINE